MTTETYVQRFLTDLETLEKTFPGLCAAMSASKDMQMRARAKAYMAAHVTLSEADQAQIAKLRETANMLRTLGKADMADDLEKQINGSGYSLAKALAAYNAEKDAPTGKANSAKNPRTSLRGVYLFPFKDLNKSILGVFENGQAPRLFDVVDMEKDAYTPLTLPAYLSKFTVTSQTGARKLVWAIVHNDVPSNCHDGTQGGKAIESLSNDPTVWTNKHMGKKSK